MLAVLVVIGKVVFVIVLLLGFLAVLVGLPGTILIFIASVVYSACTGFEAIPWWMLLILLALTVTAEVADNLLSGIGAKRYGTSTRGTWAAMAGGLLGAILGGSASPLLGTVGLMGGPVGGVTLALVGPIVGSFVGGFTGAMIYESRVGRESDDAVRAGWGAVVGRTLGILLKCAIAGIMLALVLLRVF
ncbi:MAG: DUF456 domain-containing protein [Armatimonadota bacterium]|jgi:hypothetical protein